MLVTGGAGFIGHHLVRQAVELGADVVSLGRHARLMEPVQGARYVVADISQDSLDAVGFVPHTVFHLAGGSSVSASIADPLADFLKTVYSTVQLLDYLRRNWPNADLVYVSSAAIYGEAGHKKASHDMLCLPISPYGVHRKQVEALLLDHARMYRTRSIIVRVFSVYGPGLRKQLLWDALEKAAREEFSFFGSGHELRDWVYVSDLVNCLLQAASHASTAVPVVNAGSCNAVSVREVLTRLFRAAGIDRVPVFLGKLKEGDPDHLVAEDSAETLLGPLFSTPLDEGLRAYVEWYRSVRGGADA